MPVSATVPGFLRVDLVRQKFSVEGLGIDAQNLCCLSAVTLHLVKDGDDMLPLYFLQGGEWAGGGRPSRGDSVYLKVQRKILWFDLGLGGQDECSPNDVLKLPDIPRPRISGQVIHGFGAYRLLP